MIPLNHDYNIHFVDRDFIFVQTTQTKGLSYIVEEILYTKLHSFLPSALFKVVEIAINKVLVTERSEWMAYSLTKYNYFALFDKIDNAVVAIHTVFDDVDNRDLLKKKLWVASGNFHKELYRMSDKQKASKLGVFTDLHAKQVMLCDYQFAL